MAVGIGFVEKVNRDAPSPGNAFWIGHLQQFVHDGIDESVTLSDIRLALGEMAERREHYTETELAEARGFADWCERFWSELGMEPDDGLPTDVYEAVTPVR